MLNKIQHNIRFLELCLHMFNFFCWYFTCFNILIKTVPAEEISGLDVFSILQYSCNLCGKFIVCIIRTMGFYLEVTMKIVKKYYKCINLFRMCAYCGKDSCCEVVQY